MERAIFKRNAMGMRVTPPLSKTISVVIPCFNNQNQITRTVENLVQEFSDNKLEHSLELVLIDDASVDDTWKCIERLHAKYLNEVNFKARRLASNVGAYHAILAGFEIQKGDGIIVMAADGDDPTGVIVELIKKWKGENHLVQATRIVLPNDSNQFFGGVFYTILRLLGTKNVPAGGSDYFLISKDLLDRAITHGWYAGNTLIQLFQHANNVDEVPYRKNRSNKSGWTMRKKVNLFLNTIFYSLVKPKTRNTQSFYEVADSIG
ncbi:glycosyltransferase [Bacteroidota bacterium]